MHKTFMILREICEKYSIHSLDTLFDAIQDLQNQKGFLNVSVLGQFKAGKSSFINSLIGKPVLPVASIPLTNVITTVQFGNNEKAIIFRNNHREEIDLKSLDNYISEEKNPENIHKVENARVETPGLNRIPRLILTDTPGLGSVFRHNSHTTNGWLPHTGISLLLISCTQPLSENDLRLIEDILHYGSEIIIVLTKTDLVEEKDVDKLRSFATSMLKEKFGRDFPVFEYSINNKASKENILQNLLIPLNNDLENKNIHILNYKLNSLRNQCLNYLSIAFRSGIKKKNGEHLLKEKILDEKLNKPFIKKELNLIAQNYISGTRQRLKDHLFLKHETKLTINAKKVFSKEYFNWKGNLNQIARKYETWFKEFISNELKEILKRDKEFFDEIPAEAIHHFEQYLQSFRERLDDRILNVLNVKMKTEKRDIHKKEIRNPDISIGWAFESQIDLLWFLIPMSLFKKTFYRYFLKQIPGEVQKNLYRLSAELTGVINDEIIHAKESSIRYIENELDTIEQLLSEENTDIENIRNSITLLENLKIEMNA